MKKRFFSAAVICLLGASMVFTPSCIGSFSLTNKLLSWNKTVGNKFVNELVFFAFWILPVYEVSGLADVLVLNSIEFWSGSNPMAKGQKVIEGNDGRYLVKCDGKGYDVISYNDGSKVRLDFDSDSQTWSIETANQSFELMTFVDDTHVSLPVDGGRDHRIFEISQAGVLAYSQVAGAPSLAAK